MAAPITEQEFQLGTTRYSSNHLDVAKSRGVLVILAKYERELANAMLTKLETQIGSTGLVENFMTPALAGLYTEWPPDKMRSCINGAIESKRQRGASSKEIACFLDNSVQALIAASHQLDDIVQDPDPSHQLAKEYATQLVSVLEFSCNTNGVQYANAILYVGRSKLGKCLATSPT